MPGDPGVAGQTIGGLDMLKLHDLSAHSLPICVQPLAMLFTNSSVACHNGHRSAREVYKLLMKIQGLLKLEREKQGHIQEYEDTGLNTPGPLHPQLSFIYTHSPTLYPQPHPHLELSPCL